MLEKDILDEAKWNEFLAYRTSKDFVSKKEKEQFEDFILNKKYMTICSQIALGTYSFSIPKKHLISKGHSQKKRVVYRAGDRVTVICIGASKEKRQVDFTIYEGDKNGNC